MTDLTSSSDSNNKQQLESHEIYINACKDVDPKVIDTITHLQQVAIKLLSSEGESYKHFDFTLNKQGIVCTFSHDSLVSRSRMSIATYKSFMLALPTEAINEKANHTIIMANSNDFIKGLSKLVAFYAEQKEEVGKLGQL
eukprot:TRINITY_DN7842_c0_g2_i7.p1 TRINITY_DN7842_c0_g2~~TRINITY_DN7842_c0_g2_i7.p1  ORF type:complete len:140 (-),score=44.80 TRINITY_DN7842_c0_g2_i7:131-550(-)